MLDMKKTHAVQKFKSMYMYIVAEKAPNAFFQREKHTLAKNNRLI